MNAQQSTLLITVGIWTITAILALVGVRFNLMKNPVYSAALSALERAGMLSGGNGAIGIAGGGAGAGTVAATVSPWFQLDALPTWSQQGTPLPDGNMDSQQYNDCGEACVSMVVASVHGVPVSPGSVRCSLSGIGRSGLTTGDALVQMLAYYNVASHVETVPADVAMAALIAVTSQARPVIMLGTWPTPGPLHWLLATGIAGGKISYINPWGGIKSWVDTATFKASYAGTLVIVDAHLHYDMHQHGQPN